MADRRWTRLMEDKLLLEKYQEMKRRRGEQSSSSAQDSYNVRFGRNGGGGGSSFSSSSSSSSSEEEEEPSLSSSSPSEEDEEEVESDYGVEFISVVREGNVVADGVEYVGSTWESAEEAGTGESKVGGAPEKNGDSDTVQDVEVRSPPLEEEDEDSDSDSDSDSDYLGSKEGKSKPEDPPIEEMEREDRNEVIQIDDSESESELEEVQDVDRVEETEEEEDEIPITDVETAVGEEKEEEIPIIDLEMDMETAAEELEEQKEEEEIHMMDVDEGRMPERRSVPEEVRVVIEEEEVEEIQTKDVDEGRMPERRSVPEKVRVVIEEEVEEIQTMDVDEGRMPERSVPAGEEMEKEEERVVIEEEEEDEENVQIAADKPEVSPEELSSSSRVAGRTAWAWEEVRVVSEQKEEEDQEDNNDDEISSAEAQEEDQQTEQEEIKRLWDEFELARKEEEKAKPVPTKKVVVSNGFNGRGAKKPKVEIGGLSSKPDIGRKFEINSCDDPLVAEVARDEGKVEEDVITVEAAKEKEQEQCMSKPSWKPCRKTRKVFEESEVVNILAESVLGDAKLPVDDEEDEEDNEPPAEVNENQRQVVTRRIWGCDEEASPPEKSEHEKEIEGLWEEFALAKYGDEESSSVIQEDTTQSDPEIDPSRCHPGHHQLRLDEEIGLICRICHHVELEIKYHVAPFAEEKYRYSKKENSENWDKKLLNEFYAQEDSDNFHRKLHQQEKDGTVWDIMPGIREGLHEHQQEGFEFLWRNIGGDIRLANLKSPAGEEASGCIISHAPGTGKTRLAIRFLQTYMKQFPECKPMIIVPCSMLITWEAEFKTLGVETPRFDLNDAKLTGKESSTAMGLLREYRGTQTVRWVKLYSWQKESGILLMSYKLYEELVGRGMKKKRNKTESSKSSRPIDERTKQVLLEVPGLVILDEGHNARNQDSLIWRALSNLTTKKRIVLSGTPFQNNFDEFFNILWVARPNFANSIPCGANWVSSKKKRGTEVNEMREKWQSFTCHLGKKTNDGREVKQLQELRAFINPFVHTYKGDILDKKLPGLRDSVLILKPAKFQQGQIARIQAMSHTLGLMEKTIQYFHWEHVLSLASVHPYLLSNCTGPYQTESVSKSMLDQLKLTPEAGVKTKFLMELIKICEIIEEKVLVFSQFLDPLKMISDQLEKHRNWIANTDFLYMRGELTRTERQKMMKSFNDPGSKAKVLLASTKACSEGISLIGASRVVLLDVVWNPSVARQAVSRAYRLGQTRVVHVYNLITSGTIEEQKFKRQVKKDKLSDMVLFSAEKSADCDGGRSRELGDLAEEEKDKVLEMLLERENLKGIFKEIIYQPKDSKVEDGSVPPGLIDLGET